MSVVLQNYGGVEGPESNALAAPRINLLFSLPQKPTHLFSKVVTLSFSEFITAKLDKFSFGIIYQNNLIDNILQSWFKRNMKNN